MVHMVLNHCLFNTPGSTETHPPLFITFVTLGTFHRYKQAYSLPLHLPSDRPGAYGWRWDSIPRLPFDGLLASDIEDPFHWIVVGGTLAGRRHQGMGGEHQYTEQQFRCKRVSLWDSTPAFILPQTNQTWRLSALQIHC